MCVCCCCLVTTLCSTVCDPMNCSTPGSSVLHNLLELAQIHVHWVSDAIYFILCCSLLLLPSIFPSIRVFLSEPALTNKQPKHWSFSFSISPSSEYSGWIFFRDWFELLVCVSVSISSCISICGSLCVYSYHIFIFLSNVSSLKTYLLVCFIQSWHLESDCTCAQYNVLLLFSVYWIHDIQ